MNKLTDVGIRAVLAKPRTGRVELPERLQALSKTQQRFVVRILDVLEEHNKK